jgi:hypothetical protein
MDFFEFLEIMKNLPTQNEIDKLCQSNINFFYLEYLATCGYFKLLNPVQKYHLFSTACAYESIDIAILLYKNQVDIEGVKGLMLNFLAEVGTNSEYVLFRWIWEKNEIEFDKKDILECFIKILKTNNLEFAEWFFSLDIIDFSNYELKNKIGNEVLEDANTHDDYLIAKLICEKYLKNKS